MTTETIENRSIRTNHRPGIVRRFIAGLAPRLLAVRRKRAALRDLAEMADWQLKDIGLTRGQVEDALFSRELPLDHKSDRNRGRQG